MLEKRILVKDRAYVYVVHLPLYLCTGCGEEFRLCLGGVCVGGVEVVTSDICFSSGTRTRTRVEEGKGGGYLGLISWPSRRGGCRLWVG